jgi:hypothetical protein
MINYKSKYLYIILLVLILLIIYYINTSEEFGGTASIISSTPTINVPINKTTDLAIDSLGNIYVSSTIVNTSVFMYVSTSGTYFGIPMTKGEVKELTGTKISNSFIFSLNLDKLNNLFLGYYNNGTGATIFRMYCNTAGTYNYISPTSVTAPNLYVLNIDRTLGPGNGTNFCFDQNRNLFYLTYSNLVVLINNATDALTAGNPETIKVFNNLILQPSNVTRATETYNDININSSGTLLYYYTGSDLNIIKIFNISTNIITTTINISPSQVFKLCVSQLNDIYYMDISNKLYKLKASDNYTLPALQVKITDIDGNIKSLNPNNSNLDIINMIINNNNFYFLNSNENPNSSTNDTTPNYISKLDMNTGVFSQFFNCPTNYYISGSTCVSACSNVISYDNSTCLTKCNPTQLSSSSGNTCTTTLNCNANLNFISTDGLSCVNQCSSGQIISTDYTKCITGTSSVTVSQIIPKTASNNIISYAFDTNNNLYYYTSEYYSLTTLTDFATGKSPKPIINNIALTSNNYTTPVAINEEGGNVMQGYSTQWLIPGMYFYTPPVGADYTFINNNNQPPTYMSYFMAFPIMDNGVIGLLTVRIRNNNNNSYTQLRGDWAGNIANPPGITQNIVKITDGSNANKILYSWGNRIFISPIQYTPLQTNYCTIDRVKPATITNKRSLVFTADKTGNIYYIDKNPSSLYTPATSYYGGIWIYTMGTPGTYLNVPANSPTSYYQIATLSAITTSPKTTVNVTSMVMDSSNNLYFTDADANVIKKIDNSGAITTIASGYVNNSGSTIAFNYPTNLIFDNNSTLWVCDLNGIYKLSSTSTGSSQPLFTSCPPGGFLASDSKSCVKQCPANQFVTVDGKRCVASCPI